MFGRVGISSWKVCLGLALERMGWDEDDRGGLSGNVSQCLKGKGSVQIVLAWVFGLVWQAR